MRNASMMSWRGSLKRRVLSPPGSPRLAITETVTKILLAVRGAIGEVEQGTAPGRRSPSLPISRLEELVAVAAGRTINGGTDAKLDHIMTH